MGLGFLGYTMVGEPGGTLYPIPVTSNTLDKTVTPLVDEGVHGYGLANLYGDAYSRLNYCIGAVTFEGDVGGSVFTGTGNAATAFLVMLRAAINGTGTANRFDGLNVVGSPGGGTYNYRYPGLPADYPTIDSSLLKCLCDSFSINFTAGGIVTYTSRYRSIGRSRVAQTAGTYAPALSGSYSFEPATPYEATVANDDSNPLNWFQAPFRLFGASDDATEETYLNQGSTITAWSINIANNVVMEHTASGQNIPSIVAVGQMAVTGSFTYYMPNADYSDTLKQSATVIIPFGGVKLVMGHVYINNAPVQNQGANAIVTRTVNFEAFAPGAGKTVVDSYDSYTYTSQEHDASLLLVE